MAIYIWRNKYFFINVVLNLEQLIKSKDLTQLILHLKLTSTSALRHRSLDLGISLGSGRMGAGSRNLPLKWWAQVPLRSHQGHNCPAVSVLGILQMFLELLWKVSQCTLCCSSGVLTHLPLSSQKQQLLRSWHAQSSWEVSKPAQLIFQFSKSKYMQELKGGVKPAKPPRHALSEGKAEGR